MNATIQSDKAYEFKRKYYNESLVYQLMKSEVFERLGENVKTYIKSYYNKRESSYRNKSVFNSYKNCLKAMNNNIEVFSDSLYDIYFPEE